MKSDQITRGIQDSLGSLVDSVIKDSTQKVEMELTAFKKSIEDKFKDLHEKTPILKVVLSTSPDEVKKLSTRASPHLSRLVLNSKLGLYTMLVGPAGCGKTTLAHQLSEALGLQFGSVCLTSGASETWLFGRQTPNGFVEGPFAKIYKEGGVFLADEMDAADANLLLSLNTALSHNKIINPMNGELLVKHKDFIFIGAANTNGKGATHVYTGRTRLDAATLDRFIIMEVNYDETLEQSLCDDKRLNKFLKNVRKGLKDANLDEFISTRAFKNYYNLHQAGISYYDILVNLTSNWSLAAKDVANKIYKQDKELSEKDPNRGKVLEKVEIPF